MTFYRQRGFTQVDPSAPTRVLSWLGDQTHHAGARHQARPGEITLWAAVGPRSIGESDDERDPEDDSETRRLPGT